MFGKSLKEREEEFKKQLAKEHPNLELLSEYKGNKGYVKVRCKKHNYIFESKPNWLHRQKYDCQKCYDEVRGSKTKKSLEEFVLKAKEVHGDKYDYSKVEYINNKTKVCIICKEHGEFWQRPDKHLSGQGCSKCNVSKLEETVKQILTEINIQFEEQKKFNWLGRKSLDFYLPQYNIAIECQGEQHFKSRSFFGGTKAFNKQVERDTIKRDLCAQNGIKILYVLSKKYLKHSEQFKQLYSKESLTIIENFSTL